MLTIHLLYGHMEKQNYRHFYSTSMEFVKLQFTMDAESNGCISFLDIQVQRHNSSLSTSVFCRKTHTNKCLNYNSHHHPRVLSGIVKCLHQRAINICNPENKQTELSHLRRLFLHGSGQHCTWSTLWYIHMY